MPLCKFFFITVYLIIIDNWILTLLVKITPNLIKKNVQYQINCDSSKKKFLSLFLTLRSFSITFSICYWIHQKNSESYSFAIAIEWVWRVFHKIFHHRTYSSPWNTQPLTFTVVFVLWDSVENSPCKLNIFMKRYTVFVKSGDNMHDALLFTPLKKLSYILIQLISFSFEKSTNNFSIFWYVVNKLALFCPICFVFSSLLAN